SSIWASFVRRRQRRVGGQQVSQKKEPAAIAPPIPFTKVSPNVGLSGRMAMILAGAGAAMAAEMTVDQIMAASGKTDDTSFCGTKPITLGIHDGFGIN